MIGWINTVLKFSFNCQIAKLLCLTLHVLGLAQTFKKLQIRLLKSFRSDLQCSNSIFHSYQHFISNFFAFSLQKLKNTKTEYVTRIDVAPSRFPQSVPVSHGPDATLTAPSSLNRHCSTIRGAQSDAVPSAQPLPTEQAEAAKLTLTLILTLTLTLTLNLTPPSPHLTSHHPHLTSPHPTLTPHPTLEDPGRLKVRM